MRRRFFHWGMMPLASDDVDDFLDDMLEEFDREEEERRLCGAAAAAAAAVEPVVPPSQEPAASSPAAPDANAAVDSDLAQLMQQLSSSELGRNLQQQMQQDPELSNVLGAEGDLNSLFQNLMSNLPLDVAQGLESVSGATQPPAAAAPAAAAPATVQESLDAAIKMVSDGAKGVQAQTASGTNGSDQAILEKLLGEFNELDTSSGDGAGMDDMIQKFMSEMVSKETLYSPIKQIHDKFPEWLSKNRDSLSAEQLSAYSSQLDIFQKLIVVFESNESDTSVCSGRVMELMGEMQQYGHPPQELLQELMPGVEFNENGEPILGDLSSLSGLAEASVGASTPDAQCLTM